MSSSDGGGCRDEVVMGGEVKVQRGKVANTRLKKGKINSGQGPKKADA